jgi:hypothetical protein
MASLFKNNAYQILGLDSSATQKEIVKRGKAIKNLLQIDEHPNYELDTGLYIDTRTKENIDNAIENLTRPEKRIKEFFFWFNYRDSIDEKVNDLIKKEKYNEAIKIWEEESKINISKSYFYKRNLAILLSILLDKNGQKNYLLKSIALWNELVKDEKFWNLFSKNYKLYDDLSSREDIFLDFQNNIGKYLADFYAETGKHFKHQVYFEEFYKVFNVKGEKVDDIFLKQIYKDLNEFIQTLTNIGKKRPEYIKSKSFEDIKDVLTKLKSSLNEIKKLGLYETSKIRVERDNIAEVVRSLSILLHNEYSLSEEALNLAKEANKICGTNSMKEKITKDIKTIEEVIDFNKHGSQFNLIFNNIKEGNLDKALELLNLELQKEDVPLNIRETYIKTKNDLDLRLKTHGKPIKNAPSMHLINGCGTKMYGDTLYFVLILIPILPLSRYSVTDLGDGTYNFFGKLELHKWQKIWKFIGLGIIGLFILSIMFSNSNSQTTPTSNTDQNNNGNGKFYTCGDYYKSEAEKIKPDSAEETEIVNESNTLENNNNEIDRLKSQMDSMYVDENNTYQVNSYNVLVRNYNSKIAQYKLDYSTFKEKSDAYDVKINAYNAYLDTNCTKK